MTDLLKKHNAPHCSACDRLEDHCSPDAIAVICTPCTVGAALKLQNSKKKCACGKEIASHLEQCPPCERKAHLADRMRARAKRYTEAPHA